MTEKEELSIFQILGNKTNRGTTLLKKLLQGVVSQLDAKDSLGKTPLMFCVANENADGVEALIGLGANVNALSREGTNALYMACQRGNVRMVEALVNAGGDLTVRDGLLLQTCLHAATFGGSVDVVRLLIAKKADVNARAKHGWTPLHRAAAKGFTGMCQVLVDAGADCSAALDPSAPIINQGHKKSGPVTPLVLAETANHIDTVAFLQSVEAGKLEAREAASEAAPVKSEVPLPKAVALHEKLTQLQKKSQAGAPPVDMKLQAASGHARVKNVSMLVQEQQVKQLEAERAKSIKSVPEIKVSETKTDQFQPMKPFLPVEKMKQMRSRSRSYSGSDKIVVPMVNVQYAGKKEEEEEEKREEGEAVPSPEEANSARHSAPAGKTAPVAVAATAAATEKKSEAKKSETKGAEKKSETSAADVKGTSSTDARVEALEAELNKLKGRVRFLEAVFLLFVLFAFAVVAGVI